MAGEEHYQRKKQPAKGTDHGTRRSRREALPVKRSYGTTTGNKPTALRMKEMARGNVLRFFASLRTVLLWGDTRTKMIRSPESGGLLDFNSGTLGRKNRGKGRERMRFGQ